MSSEKKNPNNLTLLEKLVCRVKKKQNPNRQWTFAWERWIADLLVPLSKDIQDIVFQTEE